MVLAFHVTSTPFLRDPAGLPVFTMGLAGVDVFFVISGFVMFVSTERPGVTPAKFWTARFVRIAPLYYLYTLVFLVLIFAADLWPADFSPIEIVKSFLFIPFENSLNGQPVPLLGVGWTLNYEALFYLVFGSALLLPDRRLQVLSMTVVFGVLIAGRFTLDPEGVVMTRFTSPILLEFLAGAGLAMYYIRYGGGRPQAGALLIAAGTIALFLVAALYPNMPRTIGFGIPAVFVLQGFVFCEKYFHAPCFAPLRLFGDASYSIYLTHGIVIHAAVLLLVPLTGPNAVVSLVVVAVALTAGLLSYEYVEHPLLAVSKHLIQKASAR